MSRQQEALQQVTSKPSTRATQLSLILLPLILKPSEEACFIVALHLRYCIKLTLYSMEDASCDARTAGAGIEIEHTVPFCPKMVDHHRQVKFFNHEAKALIYPMKGEPVN